MLLIKYIIRKNPEREWFELYKCGNVLCYDFCYGEERTSHIRYMSDFVVIKSKLYHLKNNANCFVAGCEQVAWPFPPLLVHF